MPMPMPNPAPALNPAAALSWMPPDTASAPSDEPPSPMRIDSSPLADASARPALGSPHCVAMLVAIAPFRGALA